MGSRLGESREACGPASLACMMGLQMHALKDADFRLHTYNAWGPEFEFQHRCQKLGMAADACEPSTEKLRQSPPPPKSSLAVSILKRTFRVPREILAHGHKAEGKEVFRSDLFICTHGWAYLHIHIHAPHTEAIYTYNIYTHNTHYTTYNHIHNTHTHSYRIWFQFYQSRFRIRLGFKLL